MKRKKPDFKIPQYYPLMFWKTCYKCKDEFRREKGGGFCYGSALSLFKPDYYVCQSCMSDFNSSEMDLKTFFFNEIPPPITELA